MKSTTSHLLSLIVKIDEFFVVDFVRAACVSSDQWQSKSESKPELSLRGPLCITAIDPATISAKLQQQLGQLQSLTVSYIAL